MKKQSPKSGKSIAWAIAFLALLATIIIASFFWKLVLFLEKSSFDGSHQFILAKEGEKNELISFNPDQQSVEIVDYSAKLGVPPGQRFALPLDGTIHENGQGLRDMLFGALFHHNGTVSPVDIVKLLWFSATLPKNGVSTETLPVDDQQAALRIPRLFQDKSLYAEGKSITIVNATDVSGLGTRLAKLLTDIGANVIMVSTADSPASHSSITYNGDSSYSLSRLQKILHITPKQVPSVSAISDITITIGNDMAQTAIF
ncbi:MAG: LytR C-terminal domain-containing protein [Patescibacteria group bacterium]|nr:LytR C-terminal domain-containing protein [Patescibacteria group bacterium]